MQIVIGSGKNRQTFHLPSIAAARQNARMMLALNNAITQVKSFVVGQR
jgi:hypothetical protein